MNETPITVVGRLTADPVLRATTSGTTMATFRLATNVRKKDPASGEYVDGQTSYYNVRAYRSLGANLAACLSKGQAVVVSGSLEVTEYSRQDGTKGVAGEILATAVGHDLTWGITRLTKVARSVSGESVANDPHVIASMTALEAQDAEIEQHPSTADYFTVNDDGDVVDPVTGEIRESTASAA